jgi:hypothetical protein
MALSKDYKLAIGCFVTDGSVPLMDAPNVQVSRLFDIGKDSLTIREPYSAGFTEFLNQHHAIGIQIALLAVPYGTEITQFSTLRQARALHVKILALEIAANSAQAVP